MITNLIKPYMGKLILNHFIGNIWPEFWYGLLDSYFYSYFWLFDLCFLYSCFRNHLDAVTIQKYQSLSNQRFKHNLAHMPPSNLTSNGLGQSWIHCALYVKSMPLSIGLPQTYTILLGIRVQKKKKKVTEKVFWWGQNADQNTSTKIKWRKILKTLINLWDCWKRIFLQKIRV